MADLTQDALKRFDDPSQWEGVFSVPVFVPHKVKNGDRTIDVSADRLKRIAAKINRQFRDRGVAVPFTEGHRVPDFPFPEKDQPEILSYGKDARVGTFQGQPAIFLNQYVLPGCLQKVRRYPFRSAEFYDETDEITGVALLVRDPKLDMGMVFYQQSNVYSVPSKGKTLCFYLENNMPDPTVNPMLEDDKELMPDLGDTDKDDDGLEDDIDPDFGEKFEKYMKKKYPKFYEQCGGMEDKTDDATMPPGMYQRDRLPPKVEQRIRHLEAAAKEAEDRADAVECRDKIKNLINAGYYMEDPEEEVKILRRTPKDDRDAYLRRIQRNYQRDPAASTSFIPNDEASRGFEEPDPVSGDETQKVIMYAEQHGLDVNTPSGWKRSVVEYRKAQKKQLH